MKLTIYKSYMFSRKGNRLEVECAGIGTKEQPILIEPSKNFPKSFIIIESHLYINIRNCVFDYFSSSLSKHINIENCKISYFELRSCSDISIKHTKSNHFSIIKSNDCAFINCICSKGFGLYKSNRNLIKNCNLRKRLDVNLSDGNKYENNQIPEKFIENTKERDLIQEKKTFDFINGKDTSGRKFGEIECKGTGIEEDPFIIEPIEDNYKSITIFQSVHFVKLNNFNSNHLLLAQCKNKKIENCRIRQLYINYGLDIKIKNIDTNYLKLDTCENIFIEDCNIGKLNTYKLKKRNIIFKNCNFEQINKGMLNKLGLKLEK